METPLRENCHAKSNEIIVRVKRKRTTHPVESIFLEEVPSTKRNAYSSAAISEQMKTLSTIESELMNPIPSNLRDERNRRLTLNRISSIHTNRNKLEIVDPSSPLPSLDEDSIESIKKIRSGFKHVEEIPLLGSYAESSNLIWTTLNKKVVKSGPSESFLVIDISQTTTSDLVGNNSKNYLEKPATGKKISTPLSRSLETEMENAYMTGDFTGTLELIRQGASVNHQRTNYDGISPLMIASFYGNTRVVSALLTKGADPLLLDKNTKSALDYAIEGKVKLTSTNHSRPSEVEFLLKEAMSRTKSLSQNNRNGFDDETDGSMAVEGDYVFDIFTITNTNKSGSGSQFLNVPVSEVLISGESEPSTGAPQTEAGGRCHDSGSSLPPLPVHAAASDQFNDETVSPFPPLPPASPAAMGEIGRLEPQLQYPVIRVPGLRIHDPDHVELVFDYDSDWSDLGDDEDPDSNDERYFGNDYPEDEDEDADGEGEGGDEEDSDGEADEWMRTRASRAMPQTSSSRSRLDAFTSGLNGGLDGEDEDFEQLPKFERNSIGRVFHPQTLSGLGSGAYNPSKEEMLQNLWGDMGEQDRDFRGGDDEDYLHSERLESMAKRTGMHLTTAVREFNAMGLPKYGMELSDEDDVDYMCHDDDFYMPSKDTEAYDIELDNDDYSDY